MEIIEYLNYFRLLLASITILLLLSSPIFLYFKIKKTKNEKFGNYGLIGLFIIGFSILPVNILIEEISFQELKAQLNYTQTHNLKVLVNNEKPQFDLEELFEKIKNKDFFSRRNHSHNTKEFKFEIIDKDQIYSFSLFRDSKEPKKYWIYNNNHNYELEIGKIQTSLLDEQ